MGTAGSGGSLRGRLWKGWFCLAVLFISICGANLVASRDKAFSRNDFGLDFIAFYRAGVLVANGESTRLYDMEDTREFDRKLVERERLPLGNTIGLFYNPPFFAWVFVPLARMDYPKALMVWSLAGIGFYVAAAGLLCRMITGRGDWRDWALAPALMCVSLPFVQTVLHGQNTFLSLFLLALAVTCWRAKQAFAAGLAIGILFYKPQLAAVVLAGIVLSLGWRALAGAIVSGGGLVVINMITLPGTLSEFFRRLGPNFRAMLAAHPYLWQRHATFRGFWEVLLGYNGSGLAATLAMICSGVTAVCLAVCAWRNLKMGSGDRLIMAVIAATPLIVPYYVDYDLLLLAIPAVLLSAELIQRDPAMLLPRRDVWLVRLWIAFFLLLLINPGLTGTLHVNISVPMLCGIAGILMARAAEKIPAKLGESESNIEGSVNSLWMPTAA